MHSARTLRATRPLMVAFSTLAAIAFLGACGDSAPPSPTAPRGVIPIRPDGQLLTANAATTKVILPTGKGLDVQDDPSPPPRTRYRVDFHNAPVLEGVRTLYAIFYGSWTSEARIADVFILADFLSSLG
jgi:hypothetical protein